MQRYNANLGLMYSRAKILSQYRTGHFRYRQHLEVRQQWFLAHREQNKRINGNTWEKMILQQELNQSVFVFSLSWKLWDGQIPKYSGSKAQGWGCVADSTPWGEMELSTYRTLGGVRKPGPPERKGAECRRPYLQSGIWSEGMQGVCTTRGCSTSVGCQQHWLYIVFW